MKELLLGELIKLSSACKFFNTMVKITEFCIKQTSTFKQIIENISNVVWIVVLCSHVRVYTYYI
jgi:hypothetical protein